MEDAVSKVKSFLEYSWGRAELLAQHDPDTVSELQNDVQNMSDTEIDILKDVVDHLFQGVS